MQASASLDVVNIYPPPIIAVPRSLGATACWVNRGWRWEIIEQCASGRGWEEPLTVGALLKAMTGTCGKGHGGLWQIPRCHLHEAAERSDPLSPARRLDPQGQQPARVTFQRASRRCYSVKARLPVCCVWLRALGDFYSLFSNRVFIQQTMKIIIIEMNPAEDKQLHFRRQSFGVQHLIQGHFNMWAGIWLNQELNYQPWSS